MERVSGLMVAGIAVAYLVVGYVLSRVVARRIYKMTKLAGWNSHDALMMGFIWLMWPILVPIMMVTTHDSTKDSTSAKRFWGIK